MVGVGVVDRGGLGSELRPEARTCALNCFTLHMVRRGGRGGVTGVERPRDAHLMHALAVAHRRQRL